jgi:putative hydrolase of the HAD superfamily
MKPIFNSQDKSTIFFDLNDTLIDRELSFSRALQMSLEEFTARWDNEQWNPALAVEVYEREWSKKTIIPKKAKTYVKKRRLVQSKSQTQFTCLAKSLEHSPFEITDSFLRTVLQRTKQLYVQHSTLYPDVLPTLEHLNEHYKLAIISNGKRERTLQLIEHAGLSQLFPEHTVIVPSSRTAKKPHTDIFHRALKVMRVEPHHAIMVGNSWKNDIFGGNRCGMDTVWIQPRIQKTHIKRIGRNKIITITRFKQLVALFNQ